MHTSKFPRRIKRILCRIRKSLRLRDETITHSDSCDTEQESIESSSSDEISTPCRIGSYNVKSIICCGAFSSVYYCEHVKTKEKYAAKFFNRSFIQKEENMKKILSEVSILKDVSHKNTISFVDLVLSQNGMLIVMELVDGFELYKICRGRRYLVESFARNVFEQLLKAIQHIHSLGIIHRDINPDNVMIDRRGTLKLVDYVTAERANGHCEGKKVTGVFGTRSYIAPELAQCKIDGGGNGVEFAGDKIDIWAAGVLLFWVVSVYPFRHCYEQQVLFEIAQNNVRWGAIDHVSAELKDLLQNILRTDPEARMSIEEILRHPWMKKLSNNEKEGFRSRSGKLLTQIDQRLPEKTASCSKLLPLRADGVHTLKRASTMDHLQACRPYVKVNPADYLSESDYDYE